MPIAATCRLAPPMPPARTAATKWTDSTGCYPDPETVNKNFPPPGPQNTWCYNIMMDVVIKIFATMMHMSIRK
eukprot:2030225-Karenia_brevis.AAC.1